MPRLPLLAFVTVLLAGPAAAAETIRLSGETMGTTYHVTVAGAPEEATGETLGAAIEAVLAEVNGKLSNWDPDSEVSRFNASGTTDPVPVSPAFATVMRAAEAAHALSAGKFDVTLAPLIELWGFGPRQPDDPVPSDAAIAEALMSVGQAEKLALAEDGATLTKAAPGVTVNLSAVAKGYGIDQVAAALEAQGAARYLVEIGGDLVASGTNDRDAPWSIGIERPDARGGSVETVVPVRDMGLATSGDYRNYFEVDGVRYSHIIDPTSGRPITHGTASVSVLAEDATTADALATALLVVGADEGLAIAEREGLAAYFVVRDGDGFASIASSAFENLVASE